MNRVRLTLLCLVLAAACKDKSHDLPKPLPMGDVRGWQAIPDDARMVVGIDVAAFSRSPFLVRTVDRFLGTPGRKRIADLLVRAKVDLLRDVRRVTLVRGDRADEMLLVVEGSINEQPVTEAVSALVKKNDGVLRHTTWHGKRLYEARAGAYGQGSSLPPITWFAFSATDTLIVSVGERWLRHARDPKRKKIQRDAIPEMADDASALWFASNLVGSTENALREFTGGHVDLPVQAMSGSVRTDDDAGLVGTLVFQLGSAADAEAFARFSKEQLPELNTVALSMGVRAMLHKIDVAASGSLVRASLALQHEELAKLELELFRPRKVQANE